MLVPGASLSYFLSIVRDLLGFPGGTSGKEPTWKRRRHEIPGFDPWTGKIPLEQSTLVFLPRESHGQRSLAGYSQ